MLIAQIAIPPLSGLLTYSVPENLINVLRVGDCVSVPLGRRSGKGFVVRLEKTEPGNFKFSIKDIHSITRNHPFFLEEQLEWLNWIADYYGDSLSSVLETAIPTPPTEQFREVITGVNSPSSPPRGAKARELLEYIAANLPADMAVVSKKFSSARATIKKMIAEGVLISTREEKKYEVNHVRLDNLENRNITLTAAQQHAISAVRTEIEQEKFRTFLLHGVTGSGKTEVYLQLARTALDQNKGVLILVPEIALTPQLIGRFEERLNEPLAVLHSAVNKRARWESWRALIEGKARIGLGARSAIFAPVRSLGLIVVDEEHDSSYKQNEGIRYHGRDLAVMRGKFGHCPVVLGSATPSLESWYNAIQKKYFYLSLPERPLTRPLSEIELVDLGKLRSRQMPSKTVSPKLFQLLEETLQRGEQAFILYNRRGFASYLQCQVCAQVINCPNCSVALTFHRNKNSLLCHYCGLEKSPSKYCPACPMPEADAGKPIKENQIPLLVERGAGTERAVEDLQKLFPDTRIERLDRDAASGPEELVAILNKVKSGECQLLVGTQMIAKGHDVPNVTLVGVLDSDIGLHMPDFRAAERVFHLLTQVAGRAGRGDLSGRVILQTRLPDHAVLKCAMADNYRAFAKMELQRREDLSYPPFGKIMRIVISSPDRNSAQKLGQQVATMIVNSSKTEKSDLTCLGPAPAPFEKLRGSWRFHLLLKSRSSAVLSSYLKRLKLAAGKMTSGKNKNVKIVFDLDPQDML